VRCRSRSASRASPSWRHPVCQPRSWYAGHHVHH
jgi:hypothetical protein